MKQIIFTIVTVFSFFSIFAQSGFDSKTKSEGENSVFSKKFRQINGEGRVLNKYKKVSGIQIHESRDFKTLTDLETGAVIFIENKKKDLGRSGLRKSSKALQLDFLNDIKGQLKISNPEKEFLPLSTQTDEMGIRHSKYQQSYKGLKVYGAEVVLHSTSERVNLMNGRVFSTPEGLIIRPSIDKYKAITLGLAELSMTSIIQKYQNQSKIITFSGDQAELLIYHQKGKPVLAYEMVLKPNILERWVVFLNAQTGDIIDKYNHTCTLDGVFTTSARGLNGLNRSFNIIQSGSDFFLLDPTKPMFNSAESELPNAPKGAIWTIDALESSIGGKMNLDQVKSRDGQTWNPTAVSAHNNASICYDYYRNTFNRNSLNGKGGNIVSVINITDEDGKGMDNAYWNGEFMGYGNGGEAFGPLAGALDVAGHEMTHGVIENTARLEYRNQSGALNESFADIFGALIDRDDWTLGEDVVNRSVFPSGALRSLKDPNQNGPRANGYQPKFMSQYEFLRDTPSEDNGGVHINSGIPNHAFYLFVTGAGMNKDKAEKVYYQALSNYMTRTSQFVDLRLAVIQSAKDLFGNGQEAAAASAAFDAVGIAAPGTGQSVPDTSEEIIEVNPGEQFLVVYEPEGKDIYRGLAGGSDFDVVSDGLGCKRKPSISDDGTMLYFVGEDSHLYEVDLTKKPTSPQSISSDAVWDNVAISKDGRLLAALTTSQDAKIFVFNLEDNIQVSFDLFNPTYTQGVSTGEVLYADAIEWDYSGEYLVYDAFNRVEGIFGNVEYWDVGVLRAWDLNSNSFGDGDIQKIFSDLDEGDNIGNPAIAKTNPNVIAFDYLDARDDQFYLLGLNLNTGDITQMIENNTVGYPDYTVDDKILAYTAEDPAGEVVKLIPLNADRISTEATSGTRLFNEGLDKWAVFYAAGKRQLPTKEAQTISFEGISDQNAGATVNLIASSSSSLPVRFSLVSGDAIVNGNTLILGSRPGLVTIQAYQVGNSNFTTASAQQTFCINPPSVSIAINGEVIVASSADMYQWFINGSPLGGQTSAGQITADRNGTYTVKAATVDGCLSGFSNDINNMLLILANEINDEAMLSVYPNPGHDRVRLKMLNGRQFISAQVFNAAGASVLESVNQEFSVRDLKSGLYLIKIKSDEGEGQTKFVKE